MVAQRINEPGQSWRQRAAVMVADKPKTNGGIIVKPQYLVRAQRQLRLPARAKDFLEYLDEGTYFKHGIHRQNGTQEHWCIYELPKWSREMGMPKSNIHRLREYLLSLHIIQIQVDNEGTMWIGWNLNTEEWLAPPKHGGSRAGAGRPKNQDDNGCLPSKIIQDDNEFFQDDNANRFKMITSGLNGPSWDVDSSAPIRTLSKEDQELKGDANASRRVAVAPTTSPDGPAVDVKLKKPRKVSDAPSEDDPAYKIALYFRRSITSYAPDARLPAESPKALATWVKDIRLMLGTHKRAPPDIKLVIDFIAHTSFWQPNVLSARKLKEKFDTLLLQAKRERDKANGQHQRRQGAPAPVAASDYDGWAEELARRKRGESETDPPDAA